VAELVRHACAPGTRPCDASRTTRRRRDSRRDHRRDTAALRMPQQRCWRRQRSGLGSTVSTLWERCRDRVDADALWIERGEEDSPLARRLQTR